MSDRGTGRADVVTWWVVATTTARFVEQTAETVRTRAQVVRLDARYRHCTPESRAGHLFEQMHALQFNLDAIGKGRSVRAVVTEWIGLQNGAADLWLVDGGDVVGEVQAKLVANPVVSGHQLGRDRYRGMQRLVAHDDLPGIDRVLTKGRALGPGSLGYDGRVDAHARLTGTVTHGDVHSKPLSRTDVRGHADRPVRWADRQVAAARARHIGVAVAYGAASGALLEGAAEAFTQARSIRSGETTTGAAATATVTVAVQGAVRSGVVGGLGEVVRIAATAGIVPRIVGRAAAPMAIATVAYDIAEVGVAFVRDEIDAAEFAARGGESILQTGLTCAFAALGQLALPVLPGVGGVLGGVVGGVLAAAAIDGLRWWFSDEAVDERPGPKQIEAVPSADDLLGAVTDLIAWFGLVMPAGSRPDCGGFDEWMADATSSLALDPNPA